MTQALQLELDRSTKTPLAEQIRKGTSAAIESGVFAPGPRLPSWLLNSSSHGARPELVSRIGLPSPTHRATFMPRALHCRLQAQLDLSSSVPDAHGWSSEAIDDPKKTVAGSGEMLLRGCCDTEQQTGSRRGRRRIPKR
jgi:hypothetical protein